MFSLAMPPNIKQQHSFVKITDYVILISTIKKILKVIQSLNPNKAHGYDGVSVRMLKLKSTFHNITSQLFCNC